MDPVKVEAVLKWGRPKIVTKVQSFVGLTGYYRRFLERFSKIVGPLTQLTRKDEPFVWTDKREASFEEMKQRLTSTPILIIPDSSKSFEVYCDASYEGFSECLVYVEASQVQKAFQEGRKLEEKGAEQAQEGELEV
ncbi:uncharacterized mitochondrial protein AtMg00860-like [Vigna angularis]|uniref:uncharacterized mitochondrial protein AtMg00860-like n=1 Tax=Phaseolus angularis TaxID=3914 RepID=UPI0022B57CD9|nr:uncharacterized mitochondrial protein AtMg00860-like [Vigna angularis]